MRFETSVIYHDCIFILRVDVSESEFKVQLVDEIGSRQFAIPELLHLRREADRIVSHSEPDPFIDKVITAITCHIKGPNGSFKRTI